MSLVALSGNASGTGTLTIAAPNTNSNYTLTLPQNTGTLISTKSAGTVLQVVNADLNTFLSTTSTFPLDDTIPQNTEGAEILTCAITPTSATSKLIIDVVMNVANNVAVDISIIALFQDSTANALRASWSRTIAANNPVSAMVIKHYMTSGTTSATTFKVRGGGCTGNAGTFQINGGSGTRYLGGSLISSITIMEIAA
jgi:hypothetical protein